MRREQIPITPSLLTWARERAGLSLDQAAQTFGRMADWERGESHPTYSQLEQLADTFKVPVAVFFFPAPPILPPIQETFRTLPDAEFMQLPGRIRLLLRRAKALQLNLSELTEGRNPARHFIARDLIFATNSSVEQMAADVRAYLGITVAQQIGWENDEVALKEWRRVLFDAGIFVFKDAFRVQEFSGFCLYDEIFPIIYVNNSGPKTRQTFTLFHELAHLLFRTSGIDTLSNSYLPHLSGDSRKIEVICNRFAAEFLVPEKILTAEIAGTEISEATAEELAARFHVSRESIFRRFLDRGLIDRDRYVEAAARWTGQHEGGGPGGDYYWTKLAYLGREYVSLALTQFHKNRFDETRLAEYLDTKPRNIEGLQEYFERGSA
jgi:Zn-dependent peptidase ImmA (M78 family)/transcriptional regulator with XRE-family HTH domain